ncbi:MAG TPA: PLP-dependent aminotransferase family protein [Micropepsaceae bacterium]|nr:PLP-dependent aminotransferase family protein [Micropepsaceae bacterium]
MTLNWKTFRGVAGYGDLVQRLRTGIESGELAHGLRLPSQRRLAYELNLAVGTVTRAYQVAERDGLIVSYVGRGSFVASPRAAGQTRGHQKDWSAEIDLSLDEPLEHLNPPLGEILRAIAADGVGHSLLDYHNAGWTDRHRAIGAQWVAEFGHRVAPDAVTVCAGAQHAILCSLSVCCRPGDVVMVEELSYPGFRRAAEMLGLRMEPVRLDSHGVIPAAIEDICTKQTPKALYLTPSVQNPTNCQLNAARRARVAELAERYDFAVIEDEVRPRSAVPAPPPIATLIPDRVFLIAGISKTLGGGLRAAFLAVPEKWRNLAPGAVWASIYVTSFINAEIAARMIESGLAARVSEAKVREAARRCALAERHLGHLDLRMHPGSTVAWLALPDGWTNAAAVTAVRDRGVSVVPADIFWNGRTPPPLGLRISLGAPRTIEALETGLVRIADTLSSRPVAMRM